VTPYQYVIVRFRPNLSRGEFINIGILMWADGDLLIRLHHRWPHIRCCFPTVRKDYLDAWVDLQERCQREVGARDGFHQVIESIVDDSDGLFIVSQIMFGAYPNPKKRIDELFEELVE
jgi:hypothetical protein